MKNIVCSWQNSRCPPWAPRGFEKLRGGDKGGKYTFSFSFFRTSGWISIKLSGDHREGKGPKFVHGKTQDGPLGPLEGVKN